MCLAPDHFAQSLIRVSGIHKDNVRSLFIILPDKMVHEERLAAAARSQHELVAVGRDAAFHRKVGNVDVQRLSRQTVHHLYAERRKRAAVVGLFRKEAYRLFGEGVEALFGREIGGIAGYGRPEQGRTVNGVVPGHTLHACQLAAHVIFDVPEFLRIIAPRHDIEMCAYRGQPVGMGFVQVLVYPFTVDAVAP